MKTRNKVNVVAVLKDESTITSNLLKEKVRLYLMSDGWTKNRYFEEDFQGSEIEDDVEYVKVDQKDADLKMIDPECQFTLYTLSRKREKAEVEIEDSDSGEEGDEGDEDKEDSVLLSTDLPSAQLEKLWDSLIFNDGVKQELMNYIFLMTSLHNKDVEPTLCGANNIILLHGPPGTGKTSLCKALAQNATIQLIEKSLYEEGVLVEVSANSIFSKWFGETGKQVERMFSEIKRLMADPKRMVFVLVDEIESLTSARKNSTSGQECSDAILAVNTILTEIDKIKNEKNILLFSTTNITGLIDLAFISRVDIKQYVGLPSIEAINQIYRTALLELQEKGVIKNLNLEGDKRGNSDHSEMLLDLSRDSIGLSGRTLRKIPFISLSYFNFLDNELEDGLEIEDFFSFMDRAIRKEKVEVDRLSYSTNTA